jgi:protein-L-isoaspartate O-methyltransferase
MMFKTLFDYLYSTFEIITHQISFIATLYLKFHEPSVKIELKLAHISPSDKVLHIGCGAIPYTCIILAKHNITHIVGIDNVPAIVDFANEYLTQRGLYDRINIKLGDGTNFDIHKFDVIIISHGVLNQKAVVQHVLNTMRPDTRLLLRKSTIQKKTDIDSIVKYRAVRRRRLLLTQESILLVKND